MDFWAETRSKISNKRSVRVVHEHYEKLSDEISGQKDFFRKEELWAC